MTRLFRFKFLGDRIPEIPELVSPQNLLLWIDPSDSTSYTLDGSNRVTVINDKSGNNNNPVDPTEVGFFGPTIGTNQSNGLDLMTFNGTNQFLSADYASLTTLGDQETTVFSVFKASINIAQTNCSWHDSLGENRRLLMHDPAGNIRIQDNVTNYNMTPTGVYTANTLIVGTYQMSYVGSNQFFLNGVPQTQSTPSLPATTLTITQFSIGQEYDLAVPSNLLNGDIGEYLVYDRILSSVDRQRVEQYLLNKWGI